MIILKYRLTLLALIFFSVNAASAQTGLGAFILSATNETELGIYSNQISYLSSKPYRMSPFRELEFRSQTNELGGSRQEHGLRLSPANPLEIKFTRRVFDSYQNLLSLQRDLALNEILTQRYLLAADLLYLNELRELRNSLTNTLTTRISVLEKQNVSGFFDAEEYVKLKLEQMEEFADLETTQFSIEQRVKEIEKLGGNYVDSIDPSDWSYQMVISLDEMEVLIDSLLQQPMLSSLLSYMEEKVNFAENEYKLKRWDINPGFIQGSYRHFQYEDDRSPFGISFGLTIPVFNPNKGRIAEHRLEILEAENELAFEKQKAEQEVDKLAQELKNLLLRYKNLDEQLRSYDINKLLAGVNTLNRENPTIRLKFDAQLLKIQKVQLEVKNEIFETYILLLSAANLLEQPPLLNYLSPTLDTL